MCGTVSSLSPLGLQVEAVRGLGSVLLRQEGTRSPREDEVLIPTFGCSQYPPLPRGGATAHGTQTERPRHIRGQLPLTESCGR